MRQLRFAITLPSVQVALQAALWYWERHSQPTVFVYEQIAVPAARPIGLALNAPAAVFAFSLYLAVDGPNWISDTGFELLFMVCILAFWLAVGSWLDRRSSNAGERSTFITKQLIIGRLALRLSMGAMGIFFLLFALHLDAPYFGERISRLLLLVWSIPLVAIPGVAFVRWLRRGSFRRSGE